MANYYAFIIYNAWVDRLQYGKRYTNEVTKWNPYYFV